MPKRQKIGIVKLDGAEIKDPIIKLRDISRDTKSKTLSYSVEYYSSEEQTEPTLVERYSKKYTGVGSKERNDAWTYLLTLPQHSGATII